MNKSPSSSPVDQRTGTDIYKFTTGSNNETVRSESNGKTGEIKTDKATTKTAEYSSISMTQTLEEIGAKSTIDNTLAKNKKGHSHPEKSGVMLSPADLETSKKEYIASDGQTNEFPITCESSSGAVYMAMYTHDGRLVKQEIDGVGYGLVVIGEKGDICPGLVDPTDQELMSIELAENTYSTTHEIADILSKDGDISLSGDLKNDFERNKSITNADTIPEYEKMMHKSSNEILSTFGEEKAFGTGSSGVTLRYTT